MDSERVVQSRVIRFFRGYLDYNDLGDLRHQDNKNIIKERLKAFLTEKMGYGKSLVSQTFFALGKLTEPAKGKLDEANREFYQRLKYGFKFSETPEDAPQTVYLVDFEHPENNEFAIAEEVTVKGTQEKRPDLVIYLNGIAVAVIELKASRISVEDGVRQNLTNQKDSFIGSFFATVQFCLAANESQGLRYGTVGTPEKHYLQWKSDGYQEQKAERDAADVRIEKRNAKFTEEYASKLYKELAHIFDKERFLDLIHNFIVFDKGQKKVCRYNQFYGVKRAQARARKHENGIIWHTQGSGKTLTMVWLAKWLLDNFPAGRVLIVTDREELDDQIEKTFGGVGEKIVRTKSGADLIGRLNRDEDRLICSLVHKFGHRGEGATGADYDKYIEELDKSLPKDFKATGEFFVFVDECHRTQSGKLHKAMDQIRDGAAFFGFTGTPLLKKDKKTSLEVFGSFIHTYKFNEAVEDHVVLDLRYEARDIPQDLSSPEKVDEWFNHKTRGLTPRAKAKLKERWGTMQKVYGSASRLEKIVVDIIHTFELVPRLEEGGNAILVADSIGTACKYYELFKKHNFQKCAIISSYTPNPGDLRTDTVDLDEETDNWLKYGTYLRMIGLDPDNMPEKVSAIAGKIADFEKEAKRKFVDEPKKMKLLIVVDKLLTGFDAPPCTYLFIDKTMRDHGLFQAVCRVNRLDGEEKDFGYIVDYKHLFSELKDALATYTSDNPFSGFDQEDVEGLLKGRSEEAIRYFMEMLDQADSQTEGVDLPRTEEQYRHYFCGDGVQDEEMDEAYLRLRERFYLSVGRLVRAFAEAKPYLLDKYSGADVADYEQRVKVFVDLKQMIELASGDRLDLKAYEPDMRRMIDDYIDAGTARKIGSMEDFTLMDVVTKAGETLKDRTASDTAKRGAAETIENNVRRKIVEKHTVNPKYYDEMSAILQALIEERRKGVEDYIKLLEKYRDLSEKVEKPEGSMRYPKGVQKSSARRAFFDLLGGDEETAIRVDEAVRGCSGVAGFRDDEIKQNRIKEAIYDVLGDDGLTEAAYKIVAEQTGEYK